MSEFYSDKKASKDDISALLKKKGYDVNDETLEEILKACGSDDGKTGQGYTGEAIMLDDDEAEPVSGGIMLNMFETGDGSQIAVLDTENSNK